MASLRRQRQAQAVVGVRLQDLGKRAYAATLLSGLSPVKQHVGSFTCGSLHALAVADVNGDGKPDIIANEQEELLLAGRENLRWIVWENLGGLNLNSDFEPLMNADNGGLLGPRKGVNQCDHSPAEIRPMPSGLAWMSVHQRFPISEFGLKFRHHIILDANLGGHELQVGDVGRDGPIPSALSP